MGLLRRLDEWLRVGPSPEKFESMAAEAAAEGEERTITRDLDVEQVTVEYRNGDTETFESYGSNRSDHSIAFRTEPKISHTWSQIRDYPTIDYNHRRISFETLNREPVAEWVATEKWRITYLERGNDYVDESAELERVDRIEVGS